MNAIDRDSDLSHPGGDSFLDLRRALEERYAASELIRPLRRSLYDPGDLMECAITGVVPPSSGRMKAKVERFVGGGFAGQVYRVRLLDLSTDDGPIAGLAVGHSYAVKILRPPTAFANAFRGLLYSLGFQTPFSARVNPAAVRVGVLWQKLIRRAVGLELGDPNGVCDTYATLYSEDLRSFGEINEWVDGRIWKFEVDDRLFARWRFIEEPPDNHNSSEYLHKKLFMRRLVSLLHDMGAPELARQYEWWSLKSQPNVLKRLGDDASPGAGLTAIDFRAGLTLLPFLPMSPVDVGLIVKGLRRGRLVQFDRSEPARFGRFIEARREGFEDLQPAIEELQEKERQYRASMPDVTHHGLRLLTDASLRQSVKEGTITAWKNLGRLDDAHASRLLEGRWVFRLLFLISMVPLLGRFVTEVWGNETTREHLKRSLLSPGYLARALRGLQIETLIGWLRSGRVSGERTQRLLDRPVGYWTEWMVVGWLPRSWHRFLTDPAHAWARVREAVRFTIRFLRTPAFREEFLCEQVRMGQQEGMLTEAEAAKIVTQIKDPYIQKYLRCVAVHMCTVPITQVVMVLIGAAVVSYCLLYRGLSWAESLGYGTAGALAVQLMPISPGSIARGLFVLFLMIKERDIRNYYVAAPVSFLHVIGYLAFPLQMVTHNPALARFLAGRWMMQTVRIIPVFGERGGLLEHAAFDTLFNAPLSMARGFRTNPVAWTVGTVVVSIALALMTVGGVARVWEWRQPQVQLTGVTVEAVVPYYQSGGDLHWSIRGTRVQLQGLDGPVDFPEKQWNASIRAGDLADAVIRRSFFGDEYDGLEIRQADGAARSLEGK